MKKFIISAAISVLLFCGNVISAENYVPRKFWNDTEAIKKIFQVVVPEVKRSLLDQGARYESSADAEADLASIIVNRIYPYVEKYINDNGLAILTLNEFLDSIGIDVNDLGSSNIYKFLDYAATLCGSELY
ncbi:MAG: hypothetical protein LBI26_03520 [Holosporales bacterium]|jgi:hypothetical protein|nr:hypothetical protein [Holosporales bacterium]